MDTRRWSSSATGLRFRNVFFLVLFCRTATAAAVSQNALPAPSDVLIKQTQLTWNATANDATFTVQYRGFYDGGWTPLETCSSTPLTSCDVALVQAGEENGCVRLRVAARRHRETSEPVEACSRGGHPCSPDFTLSVSPGSLTVNLNRSQNLDWKYGGQLKHRIYLRRQGEDWQDHISHSSKFFDGLEAGQRYCVKVEFVLYGQKSLGPASCEQCDTVPDFSTSKQTLIVIVTIVVSGIVLLVVFAYIQLFKSKNIKQFLQPPYTIPPGFQERLPTAGRPLVAESPSEEDYDVVSSLTPRQD
ncbi:interferon gamma receptor 2 precursor [Fundulus heteroclitus]|uniref:Fibronectin type-III domain-containing protein n=1 Tax=Fundulus heteroclitus TaxID=8078 RepID=A0A3Q2Q2D4_FUNHE|nr:interferon gamma receptor 2 precursor [Fundulus heteroclitus]